MSSLTNPTADTNNTAATAAQPAAPAARKRLWCVVRIIDYRLQCLSQPRDEEGHNVGEAEWADFGADSIITDDRESAFQLGRANGGLLMSVNGLPSTGRMMAFHAAAKALEGAK